MTFTTGDKIWSVEYSTQELVTGIYVEEVGPHSVWKHLLHVESRGGRFYTRHVFSNKFAALVHRKLGLLKL